MAAKQKEQVSPQTIEWIQKIISSSPNLELKCKRIPTAQNNLAHTEYEVTCREGSFKIGRVQDVLVELVQTIFEDGKSVSESQTYYIETDGKKVETPNVSSIFGQLEGLTFLFGQHVKLSKPEA